MRYEAVHPIDGWLELRGRLAPNRRVFAFFHASLGAEEPLVLLHTALMPAVPTSIDQVFLQNTHGAPVLAQWL
jgi:malonyl-CoA decarboxylase